MLYQKNAYFLPREQALFAQKPHTFCSKSMRFRTKNTVPFSRKYWYFREKGTVLAEFGCLYFLFGVICLGSRLAESLFLRYNDSINRGLVYL